MFQLEMVGTILSVESHEALATELVPLGWGTNLEALNLITASLMTALSVWGAFPLFRVVSP